MCRYEICDDGKIPRRQLTLDTVTPRLGLFYSAAATGGSNQLRAHRRPPLSPATLRAETLKNMESLRNLCCNPEVASPTLESRGSSCMQEMDTEM